MNPGSDKFDLMVIGAGLAGLAAALFAAGRGLSVAICGGSGGTDHCSGLIDLLGAHPVERGGTVDDPWAAIAGLVKDHPEHPYAFLDRAGIEAALKEFCGFLSSQGLSYMGRSGCNSRALTPAGTIKPSYLAPESFWPGVEALERKAPTLIVDFPGLKGFSGAQIKSVLGGSWPDLVTVRVPFPGKSGELYPLHLARMLADPEVRRQLAGSLAGAIGRAEYIGFPAVLGLDQFREVIADLEQLTRKKIFEIPTLTPGLPGLRMQNALRAGLEALGVEVFLGQLALRVRGTEGGGYRLGIGWDSPRETVLAGAVVLATGRFMGGGLVADRSGIRETLFGLWVSQPENRLDWAGDEFFKPRGHPVSRAGLQTDSEMRPVDRSGRLARADLYAAGTILAHNDWARNKCGAGVSISTAYKAVNSLVNNLEGDLA